MKKIILLSLFVSIVGCPLIDIDPESPIDPIDVQPEASYLENISILPIGDSITLQGKVHGSYRVPLWYFLNLAGVNVNYMGTMYNGSMPDNQNEGHAGYKISDIINNIDSYVLQYNGEVPDLILVLLGANNMALDYTLAIQEMGALIDRLSDLFPNSLISVGSITPFVNVEPNINVTNYNQALGPLCEQKYAEGKNVVFTDVSHDVLVEEISSDKIHPDFPAMYKVGKNWYSFIVEQFNAKNIF